MCICLFPPLLFPDPENKLHEGRKFCVMFTAVSLQYNERMEIYQEILFIEHYKD